MNTGYCTTMNAPAGCSPVSSIACGGGTIAKPMTQSYLNYFIGIQNQVNRILYSLGKNTVAVDGRIGPCTIKAINTTFASHGVPAPNVDAVVQNMTIVLAGLLSAADRSGAPAKVPSPKPKAPPSVPAPDGGVQHPSDGAIRVAGFMGFLTSPIGLIVGAASAYTLYRISKDS